MLTNGRIDVAKTVPIARCGYYEYAAVREVSCPSQKSIGGRRGKEGDVVEADDSKVFEMKLPGGATTNVGLEGSIKGNRAMWEERDGKGKVGEEKKGEGEEGSKEALVGLGDAMKG